VPLSTPPSLSIIRKARKNAINMNLSGAILHNFHHSPTKALYPPEFDAILISYPNLPSLQDQKNCKKIGHVPMFPANDLSMFPIQFQ
jgi:hypothetical protein